MSRIDRSETLDSYLKRVLALQQDGNQAPTLAELKAVARELGMSDEDMAAADAAAARHLERGFGHLQHQLWDAAVADLSSAVALNPESSRGFYGLASAYKGRWLADGHPADRAAAAEAAGKALGVDPRHAPSFALLKELNESSGPSLATMSGRSRERLLRWVGLVILIAVVVVFILLVWGGRRDTGVLGL